MNVLASILPEPWMSDALCAQTDPDAFYPEKGGSTRDAKRVCSVCPVRDECLRFAIEHNERWGVWGGYSERERRRLMRHGIDCPCRCCEGARNRFQEVA